MTDDRMDARLRAAGERWRNANTSVAGPAQTDGADFDTLASTPAHRRNWLAVASAAIVAAALVVAGLVLARHDDGGGAPLAERSARSALIGVTWTSTGYDKSYVRFRADGTVAGSDGCNAFSGRYDVTSDRITFGPIAFTSMNCVTGAGTPVPSHQVYSGTVTWSVQGDRLTLTGTPVGTVSYTSSAIERTTLTGTDWTLTRVTDREGQATYISDGSASLFISDLGKLRVDDRCNIISGEVTVNAASIDIVNWNTTERGCIDPGFTPGTSEIDAMFGDGTVDYAIAGRTLTISKPGIGRLTYQAGPATATDVTAVVGDWTLESTATSGPNSASSSRAVAQSVLTIDGSGHFTLAHRCYGEQGTVTVQPDKGTGAGTATFGTITSAQHSCPYVPVTSAESEENNFVDAVLKGETSWTVDGDTLTITNGNDQASFTRADSTIGVGQSASAPTPDIANLVGSQWTLEHLADASTGPASVPAMPSATLVFDFRPGSASAPHLHAELTLGEGTMSFPAGWTDDDVAGANRLTRAQQDFVFSTVLAGHVNWRIVGDQLLITRGDVGALIFARH